MKNKLPPFIEIYRALIATPSISATEEALDQSNADLITLLADWFKDLGFNVEVQPVPGTRNKFNMLASCGQGAGGLLLAGHTDTVPFDDGRWTRDPFTLTEEGNVPAEKKQDLLNQMWRNQCISDTYEPGSTFKIITAAAALEQGVVKLTDNFYCPGYKLVEDRRIRCAKTTGHGAETFETGIMNSCNPVFIELGERLGVENFYKYFSQFGLLSKTNVDLPGEAATIMHKKENVGPVELATISFGQSFQITPMQLVTTVSSIINGGHRITPHFGVKITGEGGKEVETLRYETKNDICTKETSETMRYLLERVVSDGSGKNAKIEGFSIGGKTATSQTLPRSDHKYISSFLGFAPADDPKVLVLVVINDPKGTYYGGQIAAPVAKEIMENILPYLAK